MTIQMCIILNYDNYHEVGVIVINGYATEAYNTVVSSRSLGPQSVVSNVPHFLTRWVSRLLRLALVYNIIYCATARVGVHRLLPFAFNISVFFHFTLLHLPSFFFTTYVSAAMLSTLHLLIFRWVSRLGTGSGTRCCGPRGCVRVRMEQKSRSKFLPWPGLHLGPWHSSGRESYH